MTSNSLLDNNESNVSKWSSVRSVSICEEMNPLYRQSMEDAHLTIDKFCGVNSQGFFAIFDGHGGRDVVDFLASRFADIFRRELEYDNGSRSVSECFTSAYLITDIQTSQEGLTVSGSTAATCLIRREPADFPLEDQKRVIYSANIGDSRAVLCREGGVAVRLTYDHTASDKLEIKRIEKSGGFILRKRVLGILSVTRSFGDHVMKKFVTSRPYTSRTEILPTDEFLIIACDGVWDVFDDSDAVNFVRDKIKSGVNLNDLADALLTETLIRNSTDNVSALVIML